MAISRTFLALALACTLALTSCTDAVAPSPDTTDDTQAPSDTTVPEPDTGPILPATSLDVTISTFNVGRLFDTTCDTGECGVFDFEAHPTPSQYEAKVSKIASAILELNTDIVLLQEIENTACLDAVMAIVGNAYSVQILGETGYPGSLDVAVLSRGKHLKTQTHREYSFKGPDGNWVKFSREFLEVHVEIAGWRVIVFSAHFRSKTNDDPARRLAEATRARQLVLDSAKAFPHALLVMGGDLNDVPGSAPLKALEEGNLLIRVASDLTGGKDATYNYDGSQVALDHLYLASNALGTYVPASSEVMRDVPNGGFGGSDHASLKATFRLVPPTE